MAKVIEFKTWGEWLKYCSQPCPSNARDNSSNGDNSDWYGSKNYNDALTIATIGWENKAKVYADAMINKLCSMIEIPHIVYDVEGINFDIDRVNRNEPEQWYMFQHKIEEYEGDNVVTIVINGFVSCGISTETLVKRGAVITAIVELLEYTSKKVRVIVNTPFNDTIHFKVTVKEPNQPLDLSRLMYATGHNSMFRRLAFRALELNPECHAKVSSYGHPFTHEKQDQGDIYFANVSWTENESWIKNPEKFILDSLKAQGVEIKE